MRHHLLEMTRCFRVVASFCALGLGLLISGCDSTSDPASPEAKQQQQARATEIQKDEEATSAELKKQKGKVPVLKSMKGRMGNATPESN